MNGKHPYVYAVIEIINNEVDRFYFTESKQKALNVFGHVFWERKNEWSKKYDTEVDVFDVDTKQTKTTNKRWQVMRSKAMYEAWVSYKVIMVWTRKDYLLWWHEWDVLSWDVW